MDGVVPRGRIRVVEIEDVDVRKDWKKAHVRRREVMELRRWGRRVEERRRADSRPFRSKVLFV